MLTEKDEKYAGCIRRPIFENEGWEEYPYSHNGTAFIAKYDDNFYLIKASHVLHGFDNPKKAKVMKYRNSTTDTILLEKIISEGNYDFSIVSINEEMERDFYVITEKISETFQDENLVIYGYLNSGLA